MSGQPEPCDFAQVPTAPPSGKASTPRAAMLTRRDTCAAPGKPRTSQIEAGQPESDRQLDRVGKQPRRDKLREYST